MSNISQETSDIEILTPNNEKVRLGDLWSNSPVLIVLVRHFGCQFCREQLHDLRNVWKKILSLGITPIVIGNGTALMAQDFVEQTGLAVPLYTNPERNVYDALGAKRPPLSALLSPRLWWAGFRTLLKGFFPKQVQGDAAQLGGVFLIDTFSEVHFEYISAYAGDNPSAKMLLSAVDAYYKQCN